jgi:hypothetical protein
MDDPPVPQGHEVLHRHSDSLVIVTAHGVGKFADVVSEQAHHRHLAGIPPQFVAAERGRDQDQRLGPEIQQSLDRPGLGPAAGDAAQCEFVALGTGLGVGGVHNFGVECVGRGEAEAQEFGPGAAQQPRTAVWPVAEFARGVEHLLPRGFGRAGRAAHHDGNQGP